jgi:hypothetical protein
MGRLRGQRLVGAHTKLPVVGFGAKKGLRGSFSSQTGNTYAVDRHALSVDADCDLGALPLLCAANTAYSGRMHMSVGGADGLGQ